MATPDHVIRRRGYDVGPGIDQDNLVDHRRYPLNIVMLPLVSVLFLS